MEAEVIVYDQKTPDAKPQTTPMSIIQLAMEKSAPIEQLERLWDLQLRYEANEAKKAFNLAMAEFKANPPDIKKDRLVSFTGEKGTTEYKHATLGNVADKINKALSAHSLSATWKTEQRDGLIIVTCTITHAQGHSESTSLSSRPDDSGRKNSIQAIGSAISYLQRYTILSLTGLATSDQDNDGNTPVECITEGQAADLASMIQEKKANLAIILKQYKIESLEQMTTAQFEHLIKIMEAKK